MPAPRTGRAKTKQETQETLVAAYNAVLDEQRLAFEAEIAEELAKFEAEKAEQLAAWKKELARTKEEDNYQFNKDQRDREDQLQVELAKRVSDVTEREVKVKEREIAIGDAEATIAKLQKSVDDIPAITAKAEATGVAKGAAEAKKEAESNARIKEAETNAKESILNNQITALKASEETQTATIARLNEELKAANARVQEIANNAVHSAGLSKVTVQNTPAGNGR